jgi:hypothetical protein
MTGQTAHRVRAWCLFWLCAGVAGCANPAGTDSKVSIIINEFMVRNSQNSGIFDSDSTAADWVELYNAGHEPAILSTFFISDDPNRPRKFRFEDTVLAPGAYYVAWGGSSSTSPDNHIGFSFSASRAKDERMIVSDALGVTVDSISFARIDEACEQDKSYGRVPDGATRWVQIAVPTPGAANAR